MHYDKDLESQTRALERTADSGAAAAPGREAPLVLIKEHLTYIPPESQYRCGSQGGRLLKNWAFPSDWQAKPGELTPVLKLQEFKAGGYEATVRLMDLEKIGSAMEGNRRMGKREESEQGQDLESLLKSAARAKRRVRLLVKNMGATNLVTLTRRETVEGGFWSTEQWAKAWDRFRRNVERVIGDFPYVAVLERHKKGNFHLHVAWVGKVNLNVTRGIWWSVCGGRGQGNVDSQYIKVRQGLERADRVAKYISKYTTKHFEESGRFNKKRYWSSRQTLEEARRYVLKAASLDAAIKATMDQLGLRFDDFMVSRGGRLVVEHMFMFPDGGGVWINVIPERHLAHHEIPF